MNQAERIAYDAAQSLADCVSPAAGRRIEAWMKLAYAAGQRDAGRDRLESLGPGIYGIGMSAKGVEKARTMLRTMEPAPPDCPACSGHGCTACAQTGNGKRCGACAGRGCFVCSRTGVLPDVSTPRDVPEPDEARDYAEQAFESIDNALHARRFA